MRIHPAMQQPAAIVLGSFIIMLCAHSLLAQPAQLANVGVAKLDITPDVPVRMYGYASRTTESQGVAGPLKAAALAIGDDTAQGPAVLLTVDNGAVPTQMRQELLRRLQAKLPLKPERLMLCNAHIHSGPDLDGISSLTGQQREHLDHYAAQLTTRLEQVVLNALASRRPARLAWTTGYVPFATNRRVLKDGKWSGFGAVPDAPADRTLSLLRVTDSDGKLLAILLNYACHNTTLRQDFNQIHADWAGCAQQSIEADHPGALAMVTLGCGADADPNPHGSVELCQRHGRAIADEVKRLLPGQFKPISPNLTIRSSPLEIPFDPPPPMDQLSQIADKSYPAGDLLKRLQRGEKPPASLTYPITTWAFGDDLAMVFLADEVVVDYALRIKRDLDGARLWINAYTNEVSGYVASNRLLKEGGYEVNNSLSALVTYGRPQRLQPPLEDRIIDRVRSLLPETYHAAPALR